MPASWRFIISGENFLRNCWIISWENFLRNCWIPHIHPLPTFWQLLQEIWIWCTTINWLNNFDFFSLILKYFSLFSDLIWKQILISIFIKLPERQLTDIFWITEIFFTNVKLFFLRFWKCFNGNVSSVLEITNDKALTKK